MCSYNYYLDNKTFHHGLFPTSSSIIPFVDMLKSISLQSTDQGHSLYNKGAPVTEATTRHDVLERIVAHCSPLSVVEHLQSSFALYSNFYNSRVWFANWYIDNKHRYI